MLRSMGVGMGGRILKISAKKDIFLISSAKKQISPLLAPLEKFWKKFPSAPPGKNLSDAHGKKSEILGRSELDILPPTLQP